MFEVNYFAVLVCAIVSMIVGSIWYGPIFGKKWMEIIGVDPESMKDPVKAKEMQKSMWKSYLLQFVLSILQIYILANYTVGSLSVSSAIFNAFWIWLGFVMPTIVGSVLWTNDSQKMSRFLIQSGYQIVMFVIYGFILGIWI